VTDDNVIPFGPQARSAWKSACLVGPKGGLMANIHNALMAVRCDPDLRECYAYDEMQRTIVVVREIGSIDPICRRVIEADYVDLVEWLQANGGMGGMGLDTARAALDRRAHERAFHPVIDYLNAVQWDGVPRLGVWLSSYLGAELNETNAHIGRMFLTAMIARVVQPGCKADHMIVLEGPQGVLKSSACSVLAGEWFSDHLPDVTSGKEASSHLRGKWLIEVAEMHAFSRAEATRLKSFISRQVEQYRPAFGRVEVYEPRQCVFVGTTNEDQYLRDATGGRRFWPVKTGVSGRIQIELLAQYRDQLFAEAMDNFNNGGTWWPDAQFERELLKPIQAARYAGDIWEDRIDQYLAGKTRVTVNDIAREGLFIEPAQMRQEHNVRIANILRERGWVARRSTKARWWELLPSQAS